MKLRDDVAVVIVTHNLQQAYRVADYVGFMYLGDLVEYASATTIFGAPRAAADRGVRQWCFRLAPPRSRLAACAARLAGGPLAGCDTTAATRRARAAGPTRARVLAGREPRRRSAASDRDVQVRRRVDRARHGQGRDRRRACATSARSRSTTCRSRSACARRRRAPRPTRTASRPAYFQAHAPALAPGERRTWVFTLARRPRRRRSGVRRGRGRARRADDAARSVPAARGQLVGARGEGREVDRDCRNPTGVAAVRPRRLRLGHRGRPLPSPRASGRRGPGCRTRATTGRARADR